MGGQPGAKIKVGDRSLESAKKDHRISFAGCTAPVPITIDGEPADSLPAHLDFGFISAAPAKCYLLRDAVYGDGKARPESYFAGKRAYALPRYVAYVFEFAPAKSAGRAGGGTLSELVASPCADFAAW